MLANLGHDVSDTTVKNILKQNGIEPAPLRSKQTTWKDFFAVACANDGSLRLLQHGSLDCRWLGNVLCSVHD